MADADCLFCKIVRHEVPATFVHEDDTVVAFRDINPQAPTHILVIPTKHISSAHEIQASDDALWASMLHVAQQLAVSEGIADGYRLVTSIGRRAGQTVDHVHIHVLGGRQMHWPPG
ncbi:MAG TPA: histidine triad nucleotide-binding protein [Candidatus Dormibacteraeota bacterium]|nr:histidine triad nucleotide-binding protein [Candidatus Dormibacteraeota bacterium]